MAATGFFRRWSRLKSGADREPDAPPVHAGAPPDLVLAPLAQSTPHPPVAPAPLVQGERPLPTIADAERLDADSDFSAFVTHGVDKAVQRLAMKKLFSDPHFRVMDGLDIYIDDYNRPDPLSAAMLASLEHTRNLFTRLADEAPPAGEPGDASGDGKPADPPDPPDPADPPQSPQGDE
jgi:hypothetical protein